MTVSLKRRQFRFSLKTIVIVAPLIMAPVYWGYCYHLANRTAQQARLEFERTYAEWEKEAVSNEQLLATTDHWLNSELAVPFRNKRRVYKEYLDALARMSKVWMFYYGCTWPNDYLYDAVRSADRRYDKGLRQLRRVAGDRYAQRVRSKHDSQLEPGWREIGFTNFHATVTR